MVVTGYNPGNNLEPVYWVVKNTWGDEDANKGSIQTEDDLVFSMDIVYPNKTCQSYDD